MGRKLKTVAIRTGIVLLAVLALGLFRIVIAPVSLAPFKDQLVSALDEALGDMKADYSAAFLTWGGWDAPVDIRVQGVKLQDAMGRNVAALPEISLGLTASGLLAGNIEPVRIGFLAPELFLVRRIDGSLGLSDAPAENQTNIGALLRDLLRDMAADNTSLALEKVTIAKMRVEIEDRLTGETWQVPDGFLSVARRKGGLEARLDARLDMGRVRTSLAVKADYDAATETIDSRWRVDDLLPALFAAPFGFWQRLTDMHVTLDGALDIVFDQTLRPQKVAFDVTSSRGSLGLTDILDNVVEVIHMRLTGSADMAAMSAELERVDMVLPKGAISFTGAVGWKQGTRIVGQGEIEDLPIRQLVSLWPLTVKGNTRVWLDKNLFDGTITRADIRLNLQPLASGETRPPEQVNIQFSFDNLTAHYLRPVPPLRGARGTAVMDAASLRVKIQSAFIRHDMFQRDLAISDATVDIINLNTPASDDADIKIKITGDTHDVIRLVDFKPLGYPSRYGLDISKISGTAVVEAGFYLPLISGLTLNDVKYRADGQFRDFGLADVVGGLDLTDGDMLVRLRQNGLNMQGPVKIEGASFVMGWREDFGDQGRAPTSYRFQGVSNDAVLEKLFPSLAGDLIRGDLTVDLRLDGKGFRLTGGALSADVTRAEIDLKEAMNWVKPAGLPSRLRADFALAGPDHLVAQYNLDVEDGADGHVAGRFHTTQKFGFLKLDVDALSLGMNDFSGTLHDADDGLVLQFSGPRYDARAVLENLFADTESPADAIAESSSADSSGMSFDVSFDEVVALNNEVFGQMFGVGRRSARGWDDVQIAATAGADKSFLLLMTPAPDGSDLHVTSEGGGGSIARGAGLLESVHEGKLDLHARLVRADGSMSGTVELRDFRMTSMRALAQVLNLGSLTGLRDNLTGEGLSFDKLHLDWSLKNGVLGLTNGSARGGSVGITFEGRLQDGMSKGLIQGTLVPANTLNSILKNVPLLGTLLTGPEGGIVAVRFTMEGDMADPDVSVNPLSALTPGIFRSLFSVFDEPNADEAMEGDWRSQQRPADTEAAPAAP